MSINPKQDPHKAPAGFQHIHDALENARIPNNSGKKQPPTKGSKTQRRKENLSKHTPGQRHV